MGMEKEMSYWKQKKQKKAFKSSYERDVKGERIFILTAITGKARRITFESWQAAKKLGWIKR